MRQYASIPQRIAGQSHEQLCEHVLTLEEALEKCQAERDELSAAFTSLSKLVYENQPHLLRQAAQEKQA